MLQNHSALKSVVTSQKDYNLNRLNCSANWQFKERNQIMSFGAKSGDV